MSNQKYGLLVPPVSSQLIISKAALMSFGKPDSGIIFGPIMVLS